MTNLAFICPHCGKVYSPIKPEFQGKKARCSCGKTIRICATFSPRLVPDQEPMGILNDAGDVADAIMDAEIGVTAFPPEEARESLLEKQYGDLEHILLASRQDSSVADSGNVNVDHADPTASPLENAKPNPAVPQQSLLLMATLVTTWIVMIFGGLMVWVQTSNSPLDQGSSFRMAFARLDQSGLLVDELSGSLLFWFKALGWLLIVSSVIWMGLASLQTAFVCTRYKNFRFQFRNVDGWLAATSIVLTFLMLGILVVHQINFSQLSRQLNALDSPTAILARRSDLPNVQRLREQYQIRQQANMRVILFSTLAPLSVFGLSMFRIWVATKARPIRPIPFDRW